MKENKRRGSENSCHLPDLLLLTVHFGAWIDSNKFTQVKVIKLGIEHYDYNTSCRNNNVRHNYSDHACLSVCLPEF